MLRVVVPPEPIVSPADVPGSHAADDATVAAIIQAVTETIDGPIGWLGRALGPQTLELSGTSFACLTGEDSGIRLPCPPLIEIESITYLDAEGDEQNVGDETWRTAGGKLWLAPGYSWPSVGTYPDAARIRYRAGYDGVTIDNGGTGDVPLTAKRAIILNAQQLKGLGAENLFLSSEEVEGIGRRQYVVSDRAAELVARSCETLLQGLKVYS